MPIADLVGAAVAKSISDPTDEEKLAIMWALHKINHAGNTDSQTWLTAEEFNQLDQTERALFSGR